MRASTLFASLCGLSGLAHALPGSQTESHDAPSKVQQEKRQFGGIIPTIPAIPGFGSGSAERAPTATVQIGTIVGVQTQVPNGVSKVNKYLGVPYAVSPPTRFMPPQKPAKLSSTLRTQAWKPACYQQFPYPQIKANFIQGVYNEPPAEESEDCLYLNVYAPSAGTSNKSVLFFIPAGEMNFANAGQPSQDGTAFAAFHDIIVVTPNFRTNIFGLPSTPQLNGTAGNLALQDQRMALQWVQDNIAAFGGDPTKVTVAGTSSGAWNAEILLMTYNDAPVKPFRAGIFESGTSMYLPLPANTTSQGWFAAAKAVGCDTASDVLSCMQKADGAQLKQIVTEQALVFHLNLDDVTLPKSPYQQVKAGNYAKVPILAGTTSQEGRFYMFAQSDEKALVDSTFGQSPIASSIPDLLKAYPASGGPYANDYEALSALFTDVLFSCTCSLRSSDFAKAGSPVWSYVYDAAFPNIAFSPDSGVYHASEIREVFQTYSGGPVNFLAPPTGLLQSEVPATVTQAALATFLNSAWAQFINNPSEGPGWEQLNAGGMENIAYLGSNGTTTGKVLQRTALTENCGYFLPLYSAYSPGVGSLSMSDFS